MQSTRELIAGGLVPVWARLEYVLAMTGLPAYTVRQLVNQGKVRAVKMDPEKAASVCVYRLQDVLDWMDEEAPKPGKFVIGERSAVVGFAGVNAIRERMVE